MGCSPRLTRDTAVSLEDDYSWHRQARCSPEQAGEDWRLFVGSVGDETALRLIEEYCSDCPVIDRCDDWARPLRAFVGIAGGRQRGKTGRPPRERTQ